MCEGNEIFSNYLVRWGIERKKSVFEKVAKTLIIKEVLMLRGQVESPSEINFSLALLKALSIWFYGCDWFSAERNSKIDAFINTPAHFYN
jgi:hypothetical protein